MSFPIPNLSAIRHRLFNCFAAFAQPRWLALAATLFVALIATSILWAQRGFGPGFGRGRSPRAAPNRGDYPTWEYPQDFRQDVFTFVRIQYDSWGGRGISDGDRLMALFCHNNDIGDGWEREGEEKEYFQQYSEKFSYPLGLKIVTYAMTH